LCVDSVHIFISNFSQTFFQVTILTIGFGDIVSASTGGRIWTCAFATAGIVILGVTVGMTSDAVMEALEIEYKKHVGNARLLRREGGKRRKMESAWCDAVEKRLKERGEPVWVAATPRTPATMKHKDVEVRGEGEKGAGWMEVRKMQQWARSLRGGGGPAVSLKLNVHALNNEEREAAAREAGVPLSSLRQRRGVRRGLAVTIAEGHLPEDDPMAIDKSFAKTYDDFNQRLESAKTRQFLGKVRYQSMFAHFQRIMNINLVNVCVWDLSCFLAAWVRHLHGNRRMVVRRCHVLLLVHVLSVYDIY
jgi:hypothetical protein